VGIMPTNFRVSPTKVGLVMTTEGLKAINGLHHPSTAVDGRLVCVP
jgi:hypothetical protein